MMRILLLLTLLALFALFIWPTRYKTYAPGEGPHVIHAPASPTRVDRLTGIVEAQDDDGTWQRVDLALDAPAFAVPPVDPNATAGPSLKHNEQVVDQGRQSVENTQRAVQEATQ